MVITIYLIFWASKHDGPPLFFFFFGGIWVWTQELCLQSRHSTAWTISLIHLLWLFWRWGLANYLQGWPWTAILHISASQVARITGVSHQCLVTQEIVLSKHCKLTLCLLFGQQLTIEMNFCGCLGGSSFWPHLSAASWAWVAVIDWLHFRFLWALKPIPLQVLCPCSGLLAPQICQVLSFGLFICILFFNTNELEIELQIRCKQEINRLWVLHLWR
jgi:hypothetical protein